jgi:hypothetical protein
MMWFRPPLTCKVTFLKNLVTEELFGEKGVAILGAVQFVSDEMYFL